MIQLTPNSMASKGQESHGRKEPLCGIRVRWNSFQTSRAPDPGPTRIGLEGFPDSKPGLEPPAGEAETDGGGHRISV